MPVREGVNNIRFKNVAGLEEEKEDLEEIVDFLKILRSILTKSAPSIPKGLFLWALREQVKR